MRKIFSLFTAVLFAGSMMAVNFTLSSADAVTAEGVTVTFAKGDGSSIPAWYDNGLRLYANNTVTVTSESTITAITFNWEQQGSKAFNTATASVGDYTHPTAPGEGKWTGSATTVTFTLGATGQLLLNTFSVTLGEGGEPVVGPTVLQAVKDSTTWDFSKITANTANALYNSKNDGIQLTGESTPSKNDEVIYADYTEDFMTIGEDFNKAAIAFKGEYPIRKNQYCQAGTLHFKAAVAGTIVVKFSDTGTSASATAVKRYLVVNGEQTEYWTSRENNGETPYDAQLNVVSEKIAVPAGDVTITGSSAITMYYVTFVPEKAVEPEGPKNLGTKTIAEFLALKNTTDTCVLTGVVSNIVNATYGNFDLTDESGKVYVYGLLTPAGESKKFADLNVAEKDTLTVLAIYNEYNGNPQAKNAIFVEVKKAPKAPAQDIEITLSSLTTPGALIWTDAVAEEGWWQIMGANEAYDFSISNVNTTEAAGVYTIDDLDADYSYISIYGEKDTTKVAFVDGSVTVAVSAEGIVTVNGTLVGSDGNNYIFNLTYKDPTAEKTVNVAVPEWQLVDDYVDYLGLFAVAGEDANGTYVQLALYMPEDATEIAGDYTEEDFDLQYFGSYVADANDAYRIFSATIKVAQNEDGKVFVTADILCYNNTLYKVTTPVGQGLSNTAVETKAVKTLRNGTLVIEKAGVKYNAQGAVLR
ncbi:MAG: hypothetical protein J5902_03380 [Paludibacteraceae bacterium]|nr:hypothetical protein [Paludibacteraceae bacterium]